MSERRTNGTAEPDDGFADYAREVGLRLARARLALGLSQEAVAHRAGLSAYTYHKFEKGMSQPGTPANPRLSTLVSVCQVLGLSVDQLLPADPPVLVDAVTLPDPGRPVPGPR